MRYVAHAHPQQLDQRVDREDGNEECRRNHEDEANLPSCPFPRSGWCRRISPAYLLHGARGHGWHHRTRLLLEERVESRHHLIGSVLGCELSTQHCTPRLADEQLHTSNILRRNGGRGILSTVGADQGGKPLSDCTRRHRGVFHHVQSGRDASNVLQCRDFPRIAQRTTLDVFPSQLRGLAECANSVTCTTEIQLAIRAKWQRHYTILELCTLGCASLPIAIFGEENIPSQELLERESLIPGDRFLREVAVIDPALCRGKCAR